MAEPQESRMLLRAPSSTSSSRFQHALWYHCPLVFAARLGWVLETWLMLRWSRSEQAAKRLAGDLPARRCGRLYGPLSLHVPGTTAIQVRRPAGQEPLGGDHQPVAKLYRQ